jgi:hypothetical protein
MSEHATIRAAIVAKLQTVSGIGQVYDYERYGKTDKDFREIYAAKDRVLGWHVRRVARREDALNNEVMTDWEIRGFMSLEDAGASELDFDTLIDAIGDAWRADPTLAGVVLYPRDEARVVPELADSGPALFAGVLCHGARLKLTTRHVIDAGRPWD